jgi:hypothetical protein
MPYVRPQSVAASHIKILKAHAGRSEVTHSVRFQGPQKLHVQRVCSSWYRPASSLALLKCSNFQDKKITGQVPQLVRLLSSDSDFLDSIQVPYRPMAGES